MKRDFIYALILSAIFMGSCANEPFEEGVNAPTPVNIDENHPKARELQAIIDEYAGKGLTGIVVALKDEEGQWEGTGGYSKIENNTKMQPGLVHANGSLTKTYTATCILKLREQNIIDIDKPITAYLPANISKKITNAGRITVKMLLSHTSGILDYQTVPFKLKWFNDLKRTLTANEILEYVENKPALFSPGEHYSYSNTNYILLSLMIDHVTGTRQGEYLRDQILVPNNLKHTYYKIQSEYIDKLPMPNYYLDRYADGRVQNISKGTRAEVYTELGDGGLVASALDYVSFLHLLANGQILSSESFDLMKTPVQGDYGLGLGRYDYQGKEQYGHTGSLLGVSSRFLYFKEQNTAVFIGINLDLDLVGGHSAQLYYEMANRIGDFIASQ